MGPLDGVRVLELGTLTAGPFTGRLLGDFGAEVIKVEAPSGGDPMREWGAETYRGRSLWWPVQSRNKKLVNPGPAHRARPRAVPAPGRRERRADRELPPGD